MDALNRCGWMHASSRGGCIDALSRGCWMSDNFSL